MILVTTYTNKQKQTHIYVEAPSQRGRWTRVKYSNKSTVWKIVTLVGMEYIWVEWKLHLEVSNGIICWGSEIPWDENEPGWRWVFPLTRKVTGEQLRASRRENTDQPYLWLVQNERSSDELREGRKHLRSVRFGWSTVVEMEGVQDTAKSQGKYDLMSQISLVSPNGKHA